jgi:hypothetical protein
MTTSAADEPGGNEDSFEAGFPKVWFAEIADDVPLQLLVQALEEGVGGFDFFGDEFAGVFDADHGRSFLLFERHFGL